MSESRKPLRHILAAMALFAVLTGLSQTASGKSPKGRLSANQFISMKPFIVPMMPKNGEKRQFTMVVALELEEEDDRDYVKSRIPLVRSRVYDLLFRLIAYRTQEPYVPSTGLIKRKMLDISTQAVGPDKITSIIVQQVYQGRSP